MTHYMQMISITDTARLPEAVESQITLEQISKYWKQKQKQKNTINQEFSIQRKYKNISR